MFTNRQWPVEENVTITFETSGTLQMPVLSARKNRQWKDLNGYLYAHCTLNNGTVPGSTNSTTTAARLRRRSTPFELNDDPTIPGYEPTFSLATDTTTTSDPFGVGTSLSDGNGIHTYQLDAPYQNVGVVYIGAFASAPSWTDALLSGLNQMKSLGVTKLIIDVTGNGGGNVAAGQYLQQTLFPDKYPGFPSEARAPQIAVDCAANFANMGADSPEYMYNYRAWCKVQSD